MATSFIMLAKVAIGVCSKVFCSLPFSNYLEGLLQPFFTLCF